MAVVTVKSAAITNRDATPAVLNNARIVNSNIQRAAGIVNVANGDSIASKYLICSIPSNAIVSDIKATKAAAGTVGAGDIGLYQTTANGGAVVDADFYASAQSIVAALTKTSVVHESGVYPYTSMEQPVWQALGLTSDPVREYDLVMTLTAATDAASVVLFEVEFTK
jgi:hypothetical protein